MRRDLDADEAALWARVMASVRPLHATAAIPIPIAPNVVKSSGRLVLPTPNLSSRSSIKPVPGVTLDGGCDKRILRGAVQPDSTIDLHGHTLRSAHALLDSGIERALTRGDRVLLLVTGKPPRAESERPHTRGAIRAAVGDWIAASRHAGAIAAIRGAHPRHGGAGALYLILRRTRP